MIILSFSVALMALVATSSVLSPLLVATASANDHVLAPNDGDAIFSPDHILKPKTLTSIKTVADEKNTDKVSSRKGLDRIWQPPGNIVLRNFKGLAAVNNVEVVPPPAAQGGRATGLDEFTEPTSSKTTTADTDLT